MRNGSHSVQSWQEGIERFLSEGEPGAALNEVRSFLAALSPFRAAPVDFVQWVDVDRVRANDYNPNRVAAKEMQLLRLSVLEDGFTQPVVTVQDGDGFVVVDGFHRYLLARDDPAVRADNGGKLPVVVLARTGLEEADGGHGETQPCSGHPRGYGHVQPRVGDAGDWHER